MVTDTKQLKMIQIQIALIAIGTISNSVVIILQLLQ